MSTRMQISPAANGAQSAVRPAPSVRESARIFRAVARLTALCALTVSSCALAFTGLPLYAFSRRASRCWRALVLRAWAQCAATIIGMKIDAHGTIPKAPFMLVVNHLSYADVVALAACAECTFIAKSEVADWPVVGRLCRLVNTIFINRRARRDIPRALAHVKDALDEGAGIVLFAEATSTRGDQVRPFKSSLLEVAARMNMPVHYASLSYSTHAGEPPATNAVCWWGEMTFPKHFFELLQMKGFRADVTFGAGALRSDDRKALARELWVAVRARFVPVA